MNKLLALFLGVILILSFASFASAATMTSSPYFIMMWEKMQNDTVSDDMFRFVQLGFDTNVDFGQNNGFNSEVQIHEVRTMTDSQLNGNSGSGKASQIDIRVGYAYFYQNNWLINGDSINVGAFYYFPFRNGYGNEGVWGTLGTLLSMNGCVGAYYSINQPIWDVTMGIINAKLGTVGNDISNSESYPSEGYNYALRFNYKPLKGLTTGFGYQRKTLQSQITSSSGADNNYDNDWIVDASYMSNNVPISGIIEYAAVSPTQGNVTEDTLTGMYAEIAYKFGDFTAYAGRAVNLTSTTANGGSYGNNIFAATSQPVFAIFSSLFSINNDYTLIGLSHPINHNTILRGEYIAVDDGKDTSGNAIKNEKAFMLQLRVSY